MPPRRASARRRPSGQTAADQMAADTELNTSAAGQKRDSEASPSAAKRQKGEPKQESSPLQASSEWTNQTIEVVVDEKTDEPEVSAGGVESRLDLEDKSLEAKAESELKKGSPLTKQTEEVHVDEKTDIPQVSGGGVESRLDMEQGSQTAANANDNKTESTGSPWTHQAPDITVDEETDEPLVSGGGVESRLDTEEASQATADAEKGEWPWTHQAPEVTVDEETDEPLVSGGGVESRIDLDSEGKTESSLEKDDNDRHFDVEKYLTSEYDEQVPESETWDKDTISDKRFEFRVRQTVRKNDKIDIAQQNEVLQRIGDKLEDPSRMLDKNGRQRMFYVNALRKYPKHFSNVRNAPQ